MAELETQTPQPPDAIAALHKMSTTAGVATEEYVAINNLAVASAILGLATALAFIGWPFLVIGLAALLCGIWALRQIHNSGGTQGGKSLAWAGILLSMLIAGAISASSIRQYRADKNEREQIEALVSRFGNCIMTGNYSGAYALMDPEFQKKATLEQFTQVWSGQQTPQVWGALQEMASNGKVEVNVNADGSSYAATTALLRFQTPRQPLRLTMTFHRSSEGSWQIQQMYELFDFRQPRQPRQRRQPTQPPTQ